jgi:hypothetical protein
MMKIVFGLDLDGYEPLTPRNTFGELICGPRRLIDVLEVRLGLAQKSLSPASRIAKYRELLEKAAADRPRFYSESFAKDGFAVAETLLGWRDGLILAGWNESSQPDSQRLRDLGDVERMGVPGLLPGFGDRIRAVLAELDYREPKVRPINVVDNPDDLPCLLREVLLRLGASFGYVYDDRVASSSAPRGSDLRKIQDALTKAGEKRRISLKHDGSVLFVTAYSEITLARFAGHLIQNNRRENQLTTVVAQRECPCLDDALRTIDEPVLGSSPRSGQRPILQVLARTLRLRWQPLDPRHLLEFLVHPVSPMNNRLRAKLAEAVSEYPGIGSDEWNEAVKSRRDYLKKEYESDKKRLEVEVKRLDEDLAKWIIVERFDPRLGAPGRRLAATCMDIARWAVGFSQWTELPESIARQYIYLASLAGELAGILKTLPLITRVQLDRLVDQVVADGTDSGDAEPETGHVHRLKMPGAILETVETVLWWDFRAPPLPAQPPWTNGEAEQLEEQGVKLQSVASRVARDNSMALRTILAARKQLVFLIPRRTGNEQSAHHPLFDRIQSVVDDKLQALDLDRYLTDPLLVRTPTSVEPIVSLGRRPLPGIQRWWKLTDGRQLGPRDLESFSSAQKYVFSPYDWVLNYKAKLRPGVLFRNKIANTSRQNGNLLHRLTELLFAPDASVRWVSSSQAEIERWVGDEWAKLLPAEAANLLLPGSRAAADRALENARRAIWALIVQLRAASVMKTTVKLCPPRAQFIGGALHGFIDLLVENSAGGRAVIDMKYGGLKQRKEELENNRQLQLAVYGYLVAQSGTWPDSAFFILTSRTLLAQTRIFFPEAFLVTPTSAGAGLETCWREFETVWNWRRTLLDRGWIELTVGGTKAGDGTGPESDASPPIPGWEASEDEDRFNQFDVLTGWAENA